MGLYPFALCNDIGAVPFSTAKRVIFAVPPHGTQSRGHLHNPLPRRQLSFNPFSRPIFAVLGGLSQKAPRRLDQETNPC
jgi:hypothetical protein